MRVKLADAFELQMGKTPDRSDASCWNGAHKWVSIADLTKAGKCITETKETISDLGVSKSGIKQVPKGTVIMSFKLSIGKTAITTEGLYTNEAIMAFIDKGIYDIDTDYIYHLFASKDWSNGTNKAVLGLTLNKATLGQIEIEIPPITEQKQAVIVLDKVDQLISLRKKQLQKLDDLVKSRFVEMFGDPETNPKGWKKESLKEHAEVIVGYPFPSEGYTETGISIVGGYNLMQGFIQWEDSKHWPNEQGYKQYLLQSNDIVMAMDRPWVNGGFKIAKVEAKYLPALLIQRTACIRGRDLEQEFLYSLLNTQRFAEHCNVTGSLVPHISNKDINSFKVIIPPEKVQKQFSAFASQADESKQTIQQGLDKLEQMKQALMQKYFG